MATKTVARGTKRTCQNSACGARFYDLEREHITCPICGSAYTIAHSPAEAVREERRPARKVEPVPVVAGEPAAEAEAEDALADVEGGEEAVAAGDDDTFLEEEEDAGGDVSGIVGGGEEEEES